VFSGWDRYDSEGLPAPINRLPRVKQDRQQQKAKHYLHFTTPLRNDREILLTIIQQTAHPAKFA
jgi:hypothetical protein